MGYEVLKYIQDHCAANGIKVGKLQSV